SDSFCHESANSLRPNTSDTTDVLIAFRVAVFGVASRVLCKSLEGFLGPVRVHPIKNAVEDPFTTVSGSESTHRANAPTYFHKEPFYHVGSTQPLPVAVRTAEEGQQLFQILLQTGNGFGCLSCPASLPPPEALQRFGGVRCRVDSFGFLQAS